MTSTVSWEVCRPKRPLQQQGSEPGYATIASLGGSNGQALMRKSRCCATSVRRRVAASGSSGVDWFIPKHGQVPRFVGGYEFCFWWHRGRDRHHHGGASVRADATRNAGQSALAGLVAGGPRGAV